MTFLSGLVLVSNVAGLVIAQSLPTKVNSAGSGTPANDHSLLVAVIGIALSLALLVAGVFLAKFRTWARVLTLAVSGLYLLFIWVQALFLAPTSLGNEDQTFDRVMMGLIWSIPFLLLLKYLSGRDVKNSMA